MNSHETIKSPRNLKNNLLDHPFLKHFVLFFFCFRKHFPNMLFILNNNMWIYDNKYRHGRKELVNLKRSNEYDYPKEMVMRCLRGGRGRWRGEGVYNGGGGIDLFWMKYIGTGSNILVWK